MLDKSKGLSRIVDGIEFYHGLYSESSICGEINGKLIYISSPEMIVTPDNMKDNMIRYHILKTIKEK